MEVVYRHFSIAFKAASPEEKVLQKRLWKHLGSGCITSVHTRSQHPALAAVVFDLHLGGDLVLRWPGPLSTEAALCSGSDLGKTCTAVPC